MDYYALMDFVVDLGYRLAMNGAETFRIEESITYILKAYGIKAEVFAIPNCLTVSIETESGKPMTRMRRIHPHGNDLDSVERYSNLSRRICAEKPSPEEAKKWLDAVDNSRIHYSVPLILVGNALGAAGFSWFYGGNLLDGFLAGLCGVLVGIINLKMDALRANQFFRTIIASFFMALLAYLMGSLKVANSADSVIIGTLMILVPGLLFTNAMRDIIYGDTNSGTNRIVQVFLIAAALALGTAAAWRTVGAFFTMPATVAVDVPCFLVQAITCAVGSIGFCILFNIHGPGMLLCALGGVLSWSAYLVATELGGTDLAGYFTAALVSSLYSEVMARIRKCPTISYLVVAIFPLIPGGSIYYTMVYAVQGKMELFADKLMHTIAIAGVISVGILIVSTIVRMITTYKKR